jgi:hypothetical protein
LLLNLSADYRGNQKAGNHKKNVGADKPTGEVIRTCVVQDHREYRQATQAIDIAPVPHREPSKASSTPGGRHITKPHGLSILYVAAGFTGAAG